MTVLNLIREFELQKMKESETVKEYSDQLLSIVNKAQEQRRLMRQDGMAERALIANHKTQSKGDNSKKNYPPCQRCGKKGHPPFKCWKRPDAQCKICNQLGHEAVICKNKSPKYEADAHVANEEEEDHLFVATYFSTKKSNFWMIDNGYTNHMTYDINIFREFMSMENKKVKIRNGDYIPAKGKGTIAIKTGSGTKIISDVLYIRDIDKNLLSVGQLVEKGFKLLFDDKYCRIFDAIKQEIL
ncbi:uncharacterized protein LOC132619565 [Lycium barbarum]|uniref:uncharacterized protein LOC132619565 n=1 Tax=Lycium barbarum TaxID=112863 RepID=UPI00293EFCDF|nr:uncharacterized protein LOC132619565 [Lycium barbarum]